MSAVGDSPAAASGGGRTVESPAAASARPPGGRTGRDGSEAIRPPFPFSAVVGQGELKLALLLAAVDPGIGGVLMRGEKGSAKTTVARGLASLLAATSGAAFVELPVGATEDRLVGTLDLAAALTGGERCFEPGLLAAAHGGVLYVDEVNLLPDHLVDVLLDVAASGINRVEREGVSHAHPSRFVLIGSMNPEEGELRPQLLDRFGLAVEVVAPTEPAVRAEAVRRRLAYDHNPAAFVEQWRQDEDQLTARLVAAARPATATARPAAAARPATATARPAAVPDSLLEAVSALCASVGAEGLRADLVICRAAAALAALEGRPEADGDDVRRVAPLALAHRRRRQPFDAPGIAPDEMDQVLNKHLGSSDGQPHPEPHPEPEPESSEGEGESGPGLDEPESESGGDGRSGLDEGERRGEPSSSTDAVGHAEDGSALSERVAAPDCPTRVVALTAADRFRSAASSGPAPAPGRRSVTESHRGRLVADRPPSGPFSSVAVGATVRAAAARRAADPDGAPLVAGDLREAVRQGRVANLVVLVVDASGSMGAAGRMEAAKGAILSLLLDAYQRRDRVALVSFRGEGAEVVLRPTSSVEVARARLVELPTGGRTPLAAGIEAAVTVAHAGARGSGNSDTAYRPLLVFVSDGRATLGPPGTDPVVGRPPPPPATAVRRHQLDAVVIDAEDGPTRLGLARTLAETMGARYLPLPKLSANTLESTIRHTMTTPATPVAQAPWSTSNAPAVSHQEGRD